MSDGHTDSEQFHNSAQVGANIIICNSKLLKFAAKRPVLGCDGIFNTVETMSTNGEKLELNTVISKDLRTGKFVAVIRQLAARKTKASRRR